MATHSSTLAWEIPWTEEPGRLPSMGLQSQTQLKWQHNLMVNCQARPPLTSVMEGTRHLHLPPCSHPTCDSWKNSSVGVRLLQAGLWCTVSKAHEQRQARTPLPRQRTALERHSCDPSLWRAVVIWSNASSSWKNTFYSQWNTLEFFRSSNTHKKFFF